MKDKTKRYLVTIGKGFDIRNVNVLRSIDDAEYKDFRDQSNDLNRIGSDRDLFFLVSANFSEYKNFCENFLKNKDFKFNHKSMRMLSLEINRKIFNFLSSFTSYVDNSRARLSRSTLLRSADLEYFDSTCKDLYDNNFSYRFLYNLRHYFTHCGMPVVIVGYNDSVEDTDKGVIKRVLNIQISRDEILKDYKWKGLKKEILQLPEQFDINPYLHQLLQCLEHLHKEKMKIYEDLIEEKAKAIIDILHLPNDQEGVLCIFIFSDYKGRSLSIEALMEALETGTKTIQYHEEHFPEEVINILSDKE
ncbi:MAG: hypothetical protein SWK76_17200 [Actinomycetota bacterium]|nr:hypothetical protein [Actinomycetota bacterium]